MKDQFFTRPILNSPYEYPQRHWELDAEGQPTHRILEQRRSAQFVTPIPKPRKSRKSRQPQFVFDEGKGLSTEEQQYDPTALVNRIRQRVDQWRSLPNPQSWGVTPETARLLQHWRSHQFRGIRPFFCQVEAVETVIWLTEVAPRLQPVGREITGYLASANEDANPDLMRLALKLATGAGKTTVMAMLIAWQTINAVRRPDSPRFTHGFLVITPGLTIKDRLRVLQPHDPDSYYATRELVPRDLLSSLDRAKIVITNYHAFQLRERSNLSVGSRKLLQGRGIPLHTVETEGQMLQRLMPGLMGIRKILVFNDEGHHCYREKPGPGDEGALKSEEKAEARKNRDAARIWISGIEIVKRKAGLLQVIDLSATPFFLRGSGYAEGTLFPWTVCDFSLMDAIECGIVKLPRVPVADNVPNSDMPKFRNLWDHIRPGMPKGRRRDNPNLDPLSLPNTLQTALEALYGHYRKVFKSWKAAHIPVPPCFIVICNNTSTSKLVYDYIAGFERQDDAGATVVEHGRLALFRNFDEHGMRLARPRTLLVDSEQLESGDALDRNFRNMAAAEIERYRREIVERTGDRQQADNITDQDLLREVMNTVGKEGRLGESIRCVVSVSMLTEGWDANNVTHILGVRAFGTQLLCEQVVGRALRRQSYDLNEEGLLDVEYADVLGIPFDFTAKPIVVKPQPPRPTIMVQAVTPDRDHLEIRFPRVAGYRAELPTDQVSARFTPDSGLELTPELVGPTRIRNEGIIGEGIELDLGHTDGVRQATLAYHLTKHLLYHQFHDANRDPKLYLFGKLKPIVMEWLDTCLKCKGGTFPAQLMYRSLAAMACERIAAAVTFAHLKDYPVRAVLDPYNPTGSTRDVHFSTTKTHRWKTDPRKCPVNWAILDSSWEQEFCRVAESHPQVTAYVKNQGLGLEVPYLLGATPRTYIPDFIVLVDDGPEGPLQLVVEIKGFRGEDAKAKKNTMETYWVPGVNRLRKYGRWRFLELTDVFAMEEKFNDTLDLLSKGDDSPFKQLAQAGGSEPALSPIPRRRSASHS